jgi:hypothetical protein
VYHGLATDRWTDPADEHHRGVVFDSLKTDIGDWIGERLPRADDDDAKTSVVNTRFVNRNTGKWLITSLTSGRAGRVAIHNPEHCYLGSGYKVIDSIRVDTLRLDEHGVAHFWTGHFEKKKPAGIESIRIYWAWTTDGHWQAPTHPRLWFAGRARLHKLYLIHPAGAGDSEANSSAYRGFMVQYVTELNRHLAP